MPTDNKTYYFIFIGMVSQKKRLPIKYPRIHSDLLHLLVECICISCGKASTSVNGMVLLTLFS